MQNHQQNHLQSLSEDSDNQHAPLTNNEGFLPSRRRQPLLSRLSTASGADNRASSSRTAATTDLNPEAPDFAPAARKPSKRKASSSARPGKSVFTSPRSDSRSIMHLDHPIIRYEDIFGKDALVRHSHSDMNGILDEDPMPPLPSNADTGHRTANDYMRRVRLEDALNIMRTRATEKVKTDMHDPTPSSSPILFTYDKPDTALEHIDGSVRLRYLPLRPATKPSHEGKLDWKDTSSNETRLTIIPSHRHRIDCAITQHSQQSRSRAGWPKNRVPVELFELMAARLSRDDVQSMRLVSKEFESKISATLFHTAVVPFNTELYDMIDEDARSCTTSLTASKGKGRARDIPEQTLGLLPSGLHWRNAKQDAEGKVYKGHGLRVFQGFGRYIKRFGMSFEVSEAQLAAAPSIKKETEVVSSYHGSYEWPPMQYLRFANLAGLEKTAEETQRMKSAFSNLSTVKEVGLCIDSGLGWLNGPDKSIKARIFQRQSSVFGQSCRVQDRQIQEAEDFWTAIQSCHGSLGVTRNAKEVTIARKMLKQSPTELRGLRDTRYANSQRWCSIAADKTTPPSPSSTEDDFGFGVLYTTLAQPESGLQSLIDKSALVPLDMRKEQKEWLMETSWAQRAFLECYMLAIEDNPTRFANIKTLNVAKISSGLVPLLAREAFWDALSGVDDVTILVKPDWRVVGKDNAGLAETHAQDPSEAVGSFHKCLLRDRVCLRPAIKKLNIGWVGGGENAEGMFARNVHVLPAPLSEIEHTTDVNANFGLVFEHVEHLTLTNCWITPPALVNFVNSHLGRALKTLILDSVSLTTHPRPAWRPQPVILAHPTIPNASVVLPGPGHPQAIAQMQAASFAQVTQQMGQQPVAIPLTSQNHLGGGFPQNIGAAQAAWFGAQAPALPAAAGVNMPQNTMYNTMFGNMVMNPAPSHWTGGHREGSWPEVIDKISPGPLLHDYLPQPAQWASQHPERPDTNLQCIEFKSCGYVKLDKITTFDQSELENGHNYQRSNWFILRRAALSPFMMPVSDVYLGRIVQYIPQRQLDALLFAWGLTAGWADRGKAEEAEYDGLLPGGTGRFSGRIERGMGIVSGVASSSL